MVVMNGGQGELDTEEHLAQAVVEISHVVAANEYSANRTVTTALLPHAERLRQFSNTSEWTLLMVVRHTREASLGFRTKDCIAFDIDEPLSPDVYGASIIMIGAGTCRDPRGPGHSTDRAR
jgi:hypothetical protein